MRNFLNFALNLAALGRVNLSPLTASVLVIGALAENKGIGCPQIAGFCLIGLFAHSFGFILNDILDRDLDKENPARKRSPLVSGTISVRTAAILAFLQVPAAVCVYLLVFDANPLSLRLLGISIVLSVLYNLFSKRGKVPRIVAEASLAASIGCLCLLGAISQSGRPSFGSILLAFTLALILLLLNSVPNHLKDILTDFNAGRSNFVLAAGATVEQSGKLSIPKGIWLYVGALQSAIFVCVIALLIVFQPPLFQCILSVLYLILSTSHLRTLLLRKSFVEIRQSYPLLNGYYNYFALSLVVVPFDLGSWLFLYWFAVGALMFLPVFLAWKVIRNPYRLTT